MTPSVDQGTIRENLAAIEKRIARACLHAGRKREEVTLVAVSKTFPAEAVAVAAALGHRVFGENYVQEAAQKAAELSNYEPPLELHLIGPLQRNKVRHAVQLFNLIHTVDRISLAEALAKEAAKKGIKRRVLLQVNISGEDSKSGARAEELDSLMQTVISLKELQLEGLMSIGTYFDESLPEEKRSSEFQALALLRGGLQQKFGLPLPHLSMGMSHDFELAIREGATLVRVGTAIFGARASEERPYNTE